MLKKEKPMLSVADIIQSQGKIWDRSFTGKYKINNSVDFARSVTVADKSQ